MFIFPAVGLGVVASGARRVTDGMMLAAARALGEHSPARTDPSGSLLPALRDVRGVARAIATAVGLEAQRAGLAPKTSPEELRDRVAAVAVDAGIPTDRARRSSRRPGRTSLRSGPIKNRDHAGLMRVFNAGEGRRLGPRAATVGELDLTMDRPLAPDEAPGGGTEELACRLLIDTGKTSILTLQDTERS